MNSVLEEILRTRKVRTESGEVVPLHSSVSVEEGVFLQDLIRSARPLRTLEIGLAYGISALFICEEISQIAGARHIVIDPEQHNPEFWRGAGISGLHRAGFGSIVDFYPLPSYRALPLLMERDMAIDMAFIDGCHNFDYVMADLFLVDKLLRTGGIVVLDDTDWPAIRKVCRYLVTNLPYKVLSSTGEPGHAGPILDRELADKLLADSAQRDVLAQLLKPEILDRDEALGLTGSCIAFQKIAEDCRPSSFYRAF